MGGFNLPPGVSVSDIPGNRPEDIAEQAFWEELDLKFYNDHPEMAAKLQPVWDGHDQELIDAVVKYAEIARTMGYTAGSNETAADESLAQAAKEEEEYANTRCAVCGEVLGFDYPRAEVVLKSTAWLSERPHLIIHQDPCFNEETMEIA